MEIAKALLASRTDVELIRDWEILDAQPMTEHSATIRGWYMDEIEKRFPEAFDKWIENCDVDDNIRNYIEVA